MNTLDYMKALKSRLDIDSDYALSKALGVTKQTISRYSKGLGHFDDDVARRVAAILEIHPGLVMLDMHRERAKTPEDRSVWQEIYKGFRTLLPRAELGTRIALA